MDLYCVSMTVSILFHKNMWNYFVCFAHKKQNGEDICDGNSFTKIPFVAQT